ncbi:MAG: acetolactate synthase small subunit [Acidimicrobiaceae bacterium]|nr:acetolactate synthase small subunit [Acidimicrobiaceae bacterium]
MGGNGANGAAKHHVLSVLVENKSGVLARIAQLFSRRGYNIYSLSVAPTEDDRFSRVTIVVDVESAPLEQITKQLHKLINVLKISEINASQAVEYELLLGSISTSSESRSEIIELVRIFDGKIVDVGFDKLTVMLAGSPKTLDDFEALLAVYPIVEIQRTGRVALQKLDRSAPTRARSKSGKAS